MELIRGLRWFRLLTLSLLADGGGLAGKLLTAGAPPGGGGGGGGGPAPPKPGIGGSGGGGGGAGISVVSSERGGEGACYNQAGPEQFENLSSRYV